MKVNNLVLICLGIAFVLTNGCCLGMGLIWGERGAQLDNCNNQKIEIEPILKMNPAFANVTLSNTCDGDHVMLNGRVNTEADWNHLLKLMTEAIGKERAKYAMSFVQYPEPKRP